MKAAAGRGRVRFERFGPPEAGVATFLVTLLLLDIVHGFYSAIAIARGNSPPPPTPNSQDIVGAVLVTFVFQLLLVCGPLVGLALRRIPIAETLGLASPEISPPPPRWGINPGKPPPPTLSRALWMALGLVLAAYPLLLGAAALAQRIPGMPVLKSGQDEEAVRLFKASLSLESRTAMIVAAVVIAPLVEEFLFRGYLYPIFRRYFGVMTGIFLNSALFAAMHVHLPSLAPLFVLAVCLTLAYEATGSLLVPMAMHALFNAFNVALLTLGVSGG
ncbi:MAG: CPBP family intramembrane metalloprotease [Verrucomicrobia bacterium]|nr:CPBP family intramembrane metalloprotease [Verrucomicrobiota bacterium]